MQHVPTQQVGGSHYSQYLIEPTDFITRNEIPFCHANILKYLLRYRAKGGLADLEKARHYVKLAVTREPHTLGVTEHGIEEFIEVNGIDGQLAQTLLIYEDFRLGYAHGGDLIGAIDRLAEAFERERAAREQSRNPRRAMLE